MPSSHTDHKHKIKLIPELTADHDAPHYLDSLELVQFVCKGGRADIFLVREKDQGTYLALKIPLATKDVPYLQREALALHLLSHPHVVAFKNLYRVNDEGTPALAMEYCQGINLQKLLETEGPLDEDTTRSIGKEITGALNYIHNQGMIHLDVAPANIILTAEGSKLTDFGNVQFLEGRPFCYSRITQPKCYNAPERLHSAIVSPASDFYSLGVTLFGCLQGTDMAEEIFTKPCPKMSADLARIIYNLLSENPADRIEAAERL